MCLRDSGSVSFNYDYRMHCDCGGVSPLTAVICYDASDCPADDSAAVFLHHTTLNVVAQSSGSRIHD